MIVKTDACFYTGWLLELSVVQKLKQDVSLLLTLQQRQALRISSCVCIRAGFYQAAKMSIKLSVLMFVQDSCTSSSLNLTYFGLQILVVGPHIIAASISR